MPLQLIHTSALELLDSSSSGYGTVARSEKLSKALIQKLSALSVLKEPREGLLLTGPQFSYHIITHAGTSWHVLTCVQQAGADYSGRNCHIAHHLILNQNEVHTLQANQHRPTPAGITLALMKSGFWVSQWAGPPRILTSEAAISAGNLPDASTQPTWKRLTGHKSNARAFNTAQYNKDCLIVVPEGTSATDVLCLLHESDWLSHSQGWGKTYTTVTDEADTYTETLRMVTVPDSSLIQKAFRTGHPVLLIDKELQIPVSPIAPPDSYPISPKDEKEAIMQAVTRSEVHYHYTEEPDWLLYDVRPAAPRKTFITIASLISLVAISGIIYQVIPDNSPHTALVDKGNSTDITVKSNLQRLTALLQADYDHEMTADTLLKLSSIQENSQEDELILESVLLLQNAGRKDSLHPSAMKRLCECARLLGLRDTDMIRLYLREVVHGIKPDDWKQQFNGQYVTEWLVLKQSEPQVFTELGSDEFQAYAPASIQDTASTTMIATAEQTVSEQDSVTNENEIKGPARISLIPRTAVSGAALPEELENIIPHLPATISTGAYVVSTFKEGEDLQPAQRLQLSEEGFRLVISQTGNPGEFQLVPEHKSGQPVSVPPSTFTIRNGKLNSIRCHAQEAVICFPVPDKENFHTNIVLASAFGIPLPEGKGISLPPAVNANLKITNADIEIVPDSIGSPSPSIRIKKRNSFPWVLSRKETENIRFSMHLPILTGHNSMTQVGAVSATYTWDDADIIQETDAQTTIRCLIKHRPDLPERLRKAFDRVANTPCCGEIKSTNSSATLAHLYYICCALANDKLTRREKKQLHQAYFKLFADKEFNKILMRLFEHDTMLHLTPAEAGSNKIKAIQVRNFIKDRLGERNTRDLIRKRICETLTRALYAAYTEQQQLLQKGDKTAPALILDSIGIGNHVELMWQFRMLMK